MVDAVADKVIVQLEARLGQYEANVARAEQKFDRSMSNIQRSAGATEAMVRRAFGAIGTAVAGIGLIALGQQAVETALRFKRFEQGLNIATGSAVQTGREIDFLRELADRLGLRFITLAENFTGLAAAARGTALEGKQTREVFEAITKAIVATGGSTEQVNGALLAVQQIISKGTVSAEELRGQLGERLPGAFQIAARAMNVTTSELGDLLQKGELAATDFLPKFAAQLGKELPSSLSTADAAFQRFQTALDDIASSTADGFMGQLGDATDDLTVVLKDLQRSGALEAVGSFLGTVIRLGAGAASVIGDLALAWRRYRLEVGVRQQQNVIDGWFTSSAARAQAQKDKARLEAELASMGNTGNNNGKPFTFVPGQAEQIDALIAAAGNGNGTKLDKKTKAKKVRAGKSAEDIQRDQENELSRLRQEELNARLQLATDAQDRAALQRQILDEELKQRTAEIKANKDLSDAQKKARLAALDRLYGSSVDENGDVVVTAPGIYRQQVSRELALREAELSANMLSLQREALEAEADLLTKRRDRLAAELRILDYTDKEERARLEASIAAGDIADAAQARALLDRQQAARREGVNRQGESPLEAYARSFDVDLGDRAEELVIQELDAVREGISGAITKRLGIKDPLLAGVIDLFVQQQIMRPLAEALSGASGGGGGLLGGIASVGRSLFGFASGGSGIIGGRGGTDTNTLSLNGVPFANVSRGETLNIGSKALGGRGGGAPTIYVDARGAVMHETFAAQILSRSRAYTDARSTQAVQAAATFTQGAVKGMPARLAQFQRDGT